jgi:hypothetical protein
MIHLGLRSSAVLSESTSRAAAPGATLEESPEAPLDLGDLTKPGQG